MKLHVYRTAHRCPRRDYPDRVLYVAMLLVVVVTVCAAVLS